MLDAVKVNPTLPRIGSSKTPKILQSRWSLGVHHSPKNTRPAGKSFALQFWAAGKCFPIAKSVQRICKLSISTHLGRLIPKICRNTAHALAISGQRAATRSKIKHGKGSPAMQSPHQTLLIPVNTVFGTLRTRRARKTAHPTPPGCRNSHPGGVIPCHPWYHL